MKFRIKHVDGLGYFPQVKLGWFSPWSTISFAFEGTLLYSEDYELNPLTTREQAIQRAKKFKEIKTKKTTYFSLDIDKTKNVRVFDLFD